jgi:predicted nucleic acid-binding protein
LSPALSPPAYREPPLTSEAAAAIPAIVLDTNVVLDWLLFRDPSSAPLAAAIVQRRVRWVGSPSMRAELAAVLQRGLAAARDADPAGALVIWDRYAEPHDEPRHCSGPLALQCADADDQVFLELACSAGARWLVSRDRALLRLARRAAALGLIITTPEHWSAPQ